MAAGDPTKPDKIASGAGKSPASLAMTVPKEIAAPALDAYIDLEAAARKADLVGLAHDLTRQRVFGRLLGLFGRLCRLQAPRAERGDEGRDQEASTVSW